MAETPPVKTKGKPTQDLIQIAEIRDGVVILTDGTMRAILMVSSINFALKSEDEQEAIIYAYQEFINSLDFSVQIPTIVRHFCISQMPINQDAGYKLDLLNISYRWTTW